MFAGRRLTIRSTGRKPAARVAPVTSGVSAYDHDISHTDCAGSCSSLCLGPTSARTAISSPSQPQSLWPGPGCVLAWALRSRCWGCPCCCGSRAAVLSQMGAMARRRYTPVGPSGLWASVHCGFQRHPNCGCQASAGLVGACMAWVLACVAPSECCC